MYAGDMSQRDRESALETALGQFVFFKSAMSGMTDRLTHEYEVFRSRNLSGNDVTYLFIIQQLLAQYQWTFPEACKCLEEDKVPAWYHRKQDLTSLHRRQENPRIGRELRCLQSTCIEGQDSARVARRVSRSGPSDAIWPSHAGRDESGHQGTEATGQDAVGHSVHGFTVRQ